MKKELLKDLERIENEALDHMSYTADLKHAIAKNLVTNYLCASSYNFRKPSTYISKANDCEFEKIGRPVEAAHVGFKEGKVQGTYEALSRVAKELGFNLNHYINTRLVDGVRELIEEEDECIIEYEGAWIYKIYQDEKKDVCWIVDVNPDCPRFYRSENM